MCKHRAGSEELFGFTTFVLQADQVHLPEYFDEKGLDGIASLFGIRIRETGAGLEGDDEGSTSEDGDDFDGGENEDDQVDVGEAELPPTGKDKTPTSLRPVSLKSAKGIIKTLQEQRARDLAEIASLRAASPGSTLYMSGLGISAPVAELFPTSMALEMMKL